MEHFVTIRAKTIDFEGSKKDYLITTCALLQCVVSSAAVRGLCTVQV